jgi:hypothetical protein
MLQYENNDTKKLLTIYFCQVTQVSFVQTPFLKK